MKELVKKIISSIEQIDYKFKILIGLSVATVTAAYITLYQENKPNVTSSTVMITNIEGNSGGSGVIIYRSSNESMILTNKHVCEILPEGGLIQTTSGEKYTVSKYRESEMHDLCLIYTQADLKYNTDLASSAPKMYEKATVSGHPNLLPNVVSSGHFSGNKVINVLTGFRECTKEDFKSDVGLLCLLFGKMPVVKTYETILVTAMIMPGSSGSAVYNEDLKISGVVFAGQGDMSYAFIVPYEYVHYFLYEEETQIKYPNYVVNLAPKLKGKIVNLDYVKQVCQFTTTNTKVKNICDIMIRDLEWRKISEF